MRFAFALIALGLVAGLPATTRAQTWDEYRPAGIGLRIEIDFHMLSIGKQRIILFSHICDDLQRLRVADSK